jgi:plastocyanin
MKRVLLAAVIVLAVLSLAGCSPRAQQVTISDTGYAPAQLTVKTGATVTWTNKSSLAHTVTTPDFDSGAIYPGATYSHTFDAPGEYQYICRYHTTESGTVTVR